MTESIQNQLQELKKENLQLKQQLEFSKRFMENSNYWETYRDKTGKLVYISPNLEEKLGDRKDAYKNGDLQITDFIHEDDIDKTIANYKKVMQGIDVPPHKCRLNSKLSLGYVLIGYKKVLDDNGQFNGIRTCISDITELEKKEKNIHNNEELLRNITDNIPALIGQLDNNLKYTYVNKRYADYTGIEVDKIIGSDAVDIISEDTFKISHPHMLKALSGEFVSFETKYKNSAGEVFYFKSNFVPNIEKNQVKGFMVLAWDITEIKESKTKFKTLVENSPLAIYMSSGLEQKAKYVNPTFEKKFGYTMQEVPTIAEWWPKAYPDENYRAQITKEWDEKVKRAIDTKSEIEPIETYVTCKDGSEKYIRWGFISTANQNWSFGLDLTKRKLAEEALREIEAKNRLIVENITDIVFRQDIQTGKYLYISESVEKIFKYTVDEAMSTNFNENNSDETYIDTIEQIKQQISNFFSGDEEYRCKTYQYKQTTKYGKLVWVETQISIVKSKDDRFELIGFISDIDKQKRAELELIKKQQITNALLNATNESAFLIDKNGILLEINDIGAKRLNTPKKYLIGKCAYDIVPTELGKARKKAVDEVFATNKPQRTIDYRAGLFLDTNIYPVTNSKGEVFQCAIFAKDITKEKQAELALKESEEQYRTIIEATEAFVANVNKKGELNFVNSVSKKIFGLEPKECIGRNAFEFVHPEDKELTINKFAEWLESDTDNFEFENRQVSVNNQVHHFKWNIRKNRTETGEVNGFSSIAVDITKQKKSELALKESEDQFKGLFTQSHVATAIVGLDTRFINCNGAFCTLIGYSKSELIEKKVADITHPEDRNIGMNDVKNIARGEMEYAVVQKRYLNKNKDVIWGELTISIVRNEVHKPLYFIIVIQDITKRYMAEKALKESESELKELNATKDKLFSVIAHDLRSPFTNIISLSDLLNDKEMELDSAQFQKFTELINSAAKNSLTLLDNLLNWSKSQTGKLDNKPTKIVLSSLLNKIKEKSNVQAAVKNISINIIQSEETVIYADVNMVNLIFRNLVSNAIKFTNPGGSVNLIAIQKSNNVEISVSDNGVGIPDDKLSQLFEINSEAQSVGTANEKGSGLGLILCKEFVEKLGGKIWVESVEGEGSDFKFTLPLN